MQILTQKVWAGAVDATSSQVMLILSVRSPNFEEEGLMSFLTDFLLLGAEIILNAAILNLAFLLITFYPCWWNPIEDLKILTLISAAVNLQFHALTQFHTFQYPTISSTFSFFSTLNKAFTARAPRVWQRRLNAGCIRPAAPRRACQHTWPKGEAAACMSVPSLPSPALRGNAWALLQIKTFSSWIWWFTLNGVFLESL